VNSLNAYKIRIGVYVKVLFFNQLDMVSPNVQTAGYMLLQVTLQKAASVSPKGHRTTHAFGIVSDSTTLRRLFVTFPNYWFGDSARG
jgi:hypothetical protein